MGNEKEAGIPENYPCSLDNMDNSNIVIDWEDGDSSQVVHRPDMQGHSDVMQDPSDTKPFSEDQ